MIFFTSDHHFGHENVIKYCNRPFSSVEEMDEIMIKRWNERVNSLDRVYHLGDFTLGVDYHKFLNRLNGQVTFITTNFHHDSRWYNALDETIKLHDVLCEKFWDTWVFMFHYPVAVWDRKHYGAWHLYGHIHNKEFVLPGFAMNVGVDHHNFYPVSYDEVRRYMIDLGWCPGWKETWIT
jgi:calcineurin-like phosphoesterase family protein